MALRALMLNKSIADKRSALTELEAVDFQTREAEIAASIEEAQTEEERSAVEEAISAFEAEKADAEDKKETLRSEIAELEAELAAIEAAAPAETGEVEQKIEERKDDRRMNLTELRSSDKYLNAYADFLKTDKDMECRALLTELADTTGMDDPSGPLPVPTYVENLIRQAWENDEVMRLVTRRYMKGIVKIGFEISATNAAFHAEGAEAPTEEELVLGIVSLVPIMAKKWITVSHEALDLNGQALIDYIFDELTYKIVKFLSDTLVGLIADTTNVPATSTSTVPGQPILKADPALGTVAAAIAALSDQAANPTVVLNKGTWAAFKAIQYAGGFNVDPFEGLNVAFSSALPAVADASEDDTYMIVGDFGVGALANYPNGDAVKLIFDEYSLAESDLVKIVGRQYIAMGIVAPDAFCRVTKDA